MAIATGAFAGCQEDDGSGDGEPADAATYGDAGIPGPLDGAATPLDSGYQPLDGALPGYDAGAVDAALGAFDSGSPVDASTGTTDASAGHDAGATGGPCDGLSYAAFGQQFLGKYCVSCHGGLLAQKNVHLDTLAGVVSSKAKVKSEVASKSMPPRGSTMPSNDERTQLSAWIDCGPN